MKKVAAMVVVTMMLLVGWACADTIIKIKPSKDDVTEKEAKRIALDFFAEKCGVETSELKQAKKWEMRFGYSSVDPEKAPYWFISFRGFENHESVHTIELDRNGKVLKWYAHGGEYETENPDLLDGAISVEPLSTDVDESTVYEIVRQAMSESERSQDLNMEAFFVRDRHFNQGDIPVWLVRIVGESQQWKAAVSHKGDILSIVKEKECFKEYTTPNENFWQVTFPGETEQKESNILFKIITGELPVEERAKNTDRWRPLLEQWIATHPYYIGGNDYEYIIEKHLGVPKEGEITQQRAEEIASNHLSECIGKESLGSNRNVISQYCIITSEDSQWEVTFSEAWGLDSKAYQSYPKLMKRYVVYVNARTGDIEQMEQE